MNLRQKLILLILMAGILPALVIGLISLQNSRAALEQQIFDQLEAQRTIKANQITQHFASAEHDIQTLADNLALMIEKQGLETAISQVDQNGQTLFSRYIERNDYYDLFLLDTEGYCFYSVTEEADYQTNLISGKFKDSGLWWIEDKPENAEAGLKYGLKPILIEHEHNKEHEEDGIEYAFDWEEIYNIIERG